MVNEQVFGINSKKFISALGALRHMKHSGILHSLAVRMTGGLLFGLLVVCLGPHPAVASGYAVQSGRSSSVQKISTAPVGMEVQLVSVPHAGRANFQGEHKSQNTRDVADWVVDSGDNRGMPFVIVDKMDARVFVFAADGQLRGAARALLGLALGDDSFPGIGSMELSKMRPDQQTTPAGRFVASMGINMDGKDVLWVDYSNGISLHRVLTNNPRERRLQRLATPTPLNKRISHGCINVPAKFFDDVVKPAFTGTSGIVYVLPEKYSNGEIFKSYYEVG